MRFKKEFYFGIILTVSLFSIAMIVTLENNIKNDAYNTALASYMSNLDSIITDPQITGDFVERDDGSFVGEYQVDVLDKWTFIENPPGVESDPASFTDSITTIVTRVNSE